MPARFSRPRDHAPARTAVDPVRPPPSILSGSARPVRRNPGTVSAVATKVPHALFAALEDAKPALLEALGQLGVVRIEYVVGFVEPYGVAVWLGTETDAQRDALSPVNPEIGTVRGVLQPLLPDARYVGEINATAAQSQETVDREYRGSWFYALR